MHCVLLLYATVIWSDESIIIGRVFLFVVVCDKFCLVSPSGKVDIYLIVGELEHYCVLNVLETDTICDGGRRIRRTYELNIAHVSSKNWTTTVPNCTGIIYWTSIYKPRHVFFRDGGNCLTDKLVSVFVFVFLPSVSVTDTGIVSSGFVFSRFVYACVVLGETRIES